MARKTQQRTLKTRQKILVAARKKFARSGYEHTIVDQIALAAGVAKGTIFAHFSDKASLLTAVRIDDLETIVKNMIIRANQPVGDDPIQTVMDLLNPWLALFASDQDFTRIFLDQADLKGGEWALRLYEACYALDQALEQLISTLINEKKLPPQTSMGTYTQGIQAFFYHVLIGLQSGATQNKADQEILLRGLLTHWLAPPS